ncbi:MAG: hypothetical protein HPY82_23235 [Gammaproteobacteria bacterium]|nr:hypothetical protein [Gammaproteobacteria bacterium]
MKITVETKVRAPASRVWQAYTTPEDIVQWNTASDDWHKGGWQAILDNFARYVEGRK